MGADPTTKTAKPSPELKVVAAPGGPSPDAKKKATVPVVSKSDSRVERAIRAAKRARNRLVMISLVLMVALPTLIAGGYFAFLASDQYASEARFSVRGSEKISADLFGMITGSASSGANVGDSYILQEYIGSREMVDRLEARIGLRERYTNPDADWFARLPSGLPVEEFVEYWQSMVSAEFDIHTGIVTLEVRAFSADDARTIAGAVVEESRALVNRLSEQSRQDMVALAAREVQFAEDRLRDARSAVAAFRSSEQTVDPAAIAVAHETLIAELDGQLAQAEAELAQISGMVGPDAPSRRILEGRIAALKQQISERRTRVSVPRENTTSTATASAAGPEGLSSQLEEFEKLQTESEFALKAYVSALASLEAARIEAKRDQRYLASFVQPSLPEHAAYPLRLLNTILVLAAALVMWGISALLYAAIKDHSV